MGTIVLAVAVGALLVADGGAAQQFQPPKNGAHGGTRIGLFGFGVRSGVDFRRSGQFVLGARLGLGVAGRDGCGADPACPGLWLNTVFGFELHYHSTFNWLLEYHGMDRMRRHRLYIGLTTRRGN